jgi:hypothetical protein
MIGEGMRMRRLAVIALLTLLAAGGGTFLTWELLLSPRATFRRLVICPIPRSVQNIQVDHCQMTSLEEELYEGMCGRVAVRYQRHGPPEDC